MKTRKFGDLPFGSHFRSLDPEERTAFPNRFYLAITGQEDTRVYSFEGSVNANALYIIDESDGPMTDGKTFEDNVLVEVLHVRGENTFWETVLSLFRPKA